MPKDVLPSSAPNGTGNDEEENYDNKKTKLIPTRTNVFFLNQSVWEIPKNGNMC